MHFLTVLHGFMGVALNLVLVPDDLPVQLVDHQVDRRVHISVTTLDEDVLALQVKVDFRLVALSFSLL